MHIWHDRFLPQWQCRIEAMSGRFILALAGIALLIPFFFLPRGIVAAALLIAGGLALLFSLAEVGRQLFKDACWVGSLIARLFRPARSDARTTPDRTGP
jgi:hypothetical protein